MSWRRGNRLRVLREEEAQGRTLEIYREIKFALGAPYLPLLIHAYGSFPGFLEMHWREFRPVVETAEFFHLAERMAADAYTRTHNYFAIPDLSSRLAELNFNDDDRSELMRVTDFFHHSVAVFLLIATIQMQAFDGRTGQLRHSSPATHSVFEGTLALVPEEKAPPNVRKIYNEMKREMNLAFINVPYLALARWPDFLALFWKLLKEVIHSPIYVESTHGVRDTAWILAREAPRPVELTVSQLIDSGMGDDDVAHLVRVTELFIRSLSSLALNVAVAKISLEGATRTFAEPKREPAPVDSSKGRPDRAA